MVIAVIGILAGFLLLALGKAKAVGKRIDCFNNLRPIALASHLYASDCENFLPPMQSTWWLYPGSDPRSDIKNGSRGRYHLLWSKYLDENTDVFQCAGNLPQLQRILRRAGIDTRGLSILFMEQIPQCLFLNAPLPSLEQFSRNDLAWSDFCSRKMAEIVSPSDCVDFGDRPGWHTLNSHLTFDSRRSPHRVWHGPWSSSEHPNYTFRISRRHAGRSNMAFLDGHMEHGSLKDWTSPIPSV